MSLKKLYNFSYRIIAFVILLSSPGMIQAQDSLIGNIFDFDHVIAYTGAIMLIAIFVLLFYNRLYVYREHEVINLHKSRNARLALVMQAGKLSIWSYYPEIRHYKILSASSETTEEYNPVDFSHFYNRDDFEQMRTFIFDISEGRRLTSTLNIRGASVDNCTPYYEIHLSILDRDHKGRVRRILGVQHNITDLHEKKASTNALSVRYETVFNSSLIDMLYYDKNGVLTDINDTACESFGIRNREEMLKEKFLFKENPLFNHIDINESSQTHTTTIVDISDYENSRYRIKNLQKKGKMYYESTINSVINQQGEMEGIYIAGRNVSEMVNSFHQQQEGAIALKKATEQIQEYVNNINYALRISDVRLVNYYPKTYTTTISNIIGKSQLQLSQLRCIRLATPRFRRAVSSVLNRMDHLTQKDIEQTIETEIRDQQGRQICLMFNLVPIYDENGKIDRYFGMCRNQTDMIETERKLAIETRKAQEAELLKESFLTNMSYEIRTPLTTVLGFAELFETDHDEADEAVFVEEIKKNTSTLLRLINDILFLSKLDADMVEFKHNDFDFAEYFDAYCQMGWSSVKPSVKTSIENPYEHLVINGDIEQLGKAIQMLCANSAFFTKEGNIRAKYEYRRGELAICIEDTGGGVDAETLTHVFDRFVRDKDERSCGTGLDLPIIEALVKKMGGTIEMQSELGKGTTVWIFLPCRPKDAEKKSNIIINN